MGSMTDPKNGTLLSKIAKAWADEIGQDNKLIASILCRFARGDFHGTPDPMLSHLLTSPNHPSPIPEPETEEILLTQKQGTIENIQEIKSTIIEDDFLIDDIDTYLRESSIYIEYSKLIEFCQSLNIPLPDAVAIPCGLRSTPTLHSKPTTANEARKTKTQLRHFGWQQEYQKLRREKPNMSDTWIAKEIEKMPIAEGCAQGTIRKNMKVR